MVRFLYKNSGSSALLVLESIGIRSIWCEHDSLRKTPPVRTCLSLLLNDGLVSEHGLRERMIAAKRLLVISLQPDCSPEPGLSSLSEKLLGVLHTNFDVNIGKTIREEKQWKQAQIGQKP